VAHGVQNPGDWLDKINANAKRDSRINRLLALKGWLVVRFWEHELRGGAVFNKKISRIRKIAT
jgi:G:T-mismatch repair DNA endonuclease (very short patch repair protein)